MSPRLLVVEDDPAIRGMLERGLRLAGHEPTFVGDIASARSTWSRGEFDVVLLDVMLPDGDGISLLAERRMAGDGTPVILVSAREEGELSARALAAGATAMLAKPFSYGDLVELLARLTARGQPRPGSGSSRGAPTGG